MFLDTKRVAELFGVTPLTIYKWAKSGKIPSYTIGGVKRFNYNEIMAHIKGRNTK